MIATIRLILLTALRDRLLNAVLALLLVSTALSVFLGGTALVEQAQLALVFAAGVGRIILILGLTIFTAFHIQGLFETREIEAIFSRAIARPVFVFAYWMGLAALAAFIVVLFGGGIALTSVAPLSGVLFWCASLLVECLIVLAIALFAGLMLERATATVLFTLGFYALARLMGFFFAIRETATDLTPVTVAIKHVLDVVLLVMPRLDLLAQTRWLVYGPERVDLAFLALQGGLFIAVALTAAMIDLKRKQF